MPTDPWSGAVTPAGTAAGNVPAAMDAYQLSVAENFVGSFTSTAARDSGSTGLVISGKKGMTAYVDSRKCLCIYTGTGPSNGWDWIGSPKILYSFAPGGYVNYVGIGDTKVVADTGALALAGGKRLLLINGGCDWQGNVPLAGAGSVNAAVAGSGISGGNMFARIDSPGQPHQQSVARQWFVAVNGTVTYSLALVGSTGTIGAVDAYNVVLQVVDLGPCE